MIQEKQTNKVYFSDLLPKRFPEIYNEIIFHLNQKDISNELIKSTKDIWCRDYMPVQINREEFIQFNFCPSYLWNFKKYQSLITNTNELNYNLSKKTIYQSQIKLDGGNVVKSSNRLIVTDRIFEENKLYGFEELITELKLIFKTNKITIIPQLPGDFTGHCDGMIRFINEETILINNFSGLQKGKYYHNLKLHLLNAGYKLIELPYDVFNNKSLMDDTGNYANFLEIGNLIFLPFYGTGTDGLAFYEIKQNFIDREIIPIYCNELTKLGGGLNCISWSIKN